MMETRRISKQSEKFKSRHSDLISSQALPILQGSELDNKLLQIVHKVLIIHFRHWENNQFNFGFELNNHDA